MLSERVVPYLSNIINAPSLICAPCHFLWKKGGHTKLLKDIEVVGIFAHILNIIFRTSELQHPQGVY